MEERMNYLQLLMKHIQITANKLSIEEEKELCTEKEYEKLKECYNTLEKNKLI